MIDIENQNPMAAILQIISNARRRHIKQSPLCNLGEHCGFAAFSMKPRGERGQTRAEQKTKSPRRKSAEDGRTFSIHNTAAQYRRCGRESKQSQQARPTACEPI